MVPSFSFAELGTAQPQLVTYFVCNNSVSDLTEEISGLFLLKCFALIAAVISFISAQHQSIHTASCLMRCHTLELLQQALTSLM